MKNTRQTSENENESDRQILERYVVSGDNDAFRTILTRYQSMVLGVCRRVLWCRSDAEDAFQQTFILLAKNPHRIRKRDSLGPWLYGVAFRISRQILRRRKKRTFVELDEETLVARSVIEEIELQHTKAVLDEELSALPDQYRNPLVLHYLMGKSRRQIASELGTSLNVVKGNLQRGREALKIRMALRGTQLAVALPLVGYLARESSVAVATMLSLADRTADQCNGIWTKPNSRLIGLNKGANTVSSTLAIAMFGICLTSIGLTFVKDSSAIPVPSVLPLANTVQPGFETTFIAVANDSDDNKATTLVPQSLKYGDGKADGKKSLAGTGEMLKFQMPLETTKLRGIRIHGSRYGYPTPPKEDFIVYVLSEDGKEVVSTQLFPYSKFKRGKEKWVTLSFKKPIETPSTFWIALDFKAARTKGVYVSFDTSTDGTHSKIGLPGKQQKNAKIDGDWMIQALLK